MNHTHLRPDEIDQFLDGEDGFGTAPLAARVAECEECRDKVKDARIVTGLIEKIPHLSPSHRFSERVMAQVPVVVPWHAAARNAIAEWLPVAGRSRRVALGAGVVMAVVLGLITIGLAALSDLLVFAASVGVDRIRRMAVDGLDGLVANLFGGQTFSAIAQYGTVGFALAGCAMLLGFAAAFASLRALAASASRRRG